jgi:hypothetical protein
MVKEGGGGRSHLTDPKLNSAKIYYIQALPFWGLGASCSRGTRPAIYLAGKLYRTALIVLARQVQILVGRPYKALSIGKRRVAQSCNVLEKLFRQHV